MCGQLVAQPGKREQFTEIMLRAADIVSTLAGCNMYAVTHDQGDDVTLWIMEMWIDKEAHDASLKDPRVRALIQEALPLMDGEPDGAGLTVIGGYGI